MRFPQASTPAARLQLATQAPAVFLGPGQGTAAPTWLHLSRLGPFSVWACACKLVNVSAQKLVSDHQRLCDFVSRSTALNTVGAAARCHSCRNQHHYLPTRKQEERDSKRGRGRDRYGRQIDGERAREREGSLFQRETVRQFQGDHGSGKGSEHTPAQHVRAS